MKIKKEHIKELYALLDETVKRMEKVKPLQDWINELQTNPGIKDVDMRFRWDMFYLIPSVERTEFIDTIYQYANDNHLDSVLKKYVKDQLFLS